MIIAMLLVAVIQICVVDNKAALLNFEADTKPCMIDGLVVDNEVSIKLKIKSMN